MEALVAAERPGSTQKTSLQEILNHQDRVLFKVKEDVKHERLRLHYLQPLGIHHAAREKGKWDIAFA